MSVDLAAEKRWISDVFAKLCQGGEHVLTPAPPASLAAGILGCTDPAAPGLQNGPDGQGLGSVGLRHDVQGWNAHDRYLSGQGKTFGHTQANAQAGVGTWSQADRQAGQSIGSNALLAQEPVHAGHQFNGVSVDRVPGFLSQDPSPGGVIQGQAGHLRRGINGK